MSAPPKKKGRVTLPRMSFVNDLETRKSKTLQRRVSWRASTESIQTLLSLHEQDYDEGDPRKKLLHQDNAFEMSQWPSADPLVSKRRSSLRQLTDAKRSSNGSGGSDGSGGGRGSSSRRLDYSCGNCCFSKKAPIDGVFDGPVVKIKTSHIIPIDFMSEYQGNIKPNSTAIIACNGDVTYTFEELNWMSDQLALQLKPTIEEELHSIFFKDVLQEPEFEPCVGVAIDPGEKCLLGILSIWKLGLPYLPIRTHEAPPWRISMIVDSLKPLVILGQPQDTALEESAKNGSRLLLLEEHLEAALKNCPNKTPMSKEERKRKLAIDTLEQFRSQIQQETDPSQRCIAIFNRFNDHGEIIATYIRATTVWNRVYAEWKHFPFAKNEKVGVYASIDTHEFLGQMLTALLYGSTAVIMNSHDFYKFLENIARWKLKRLMIFPELLRAMVIMMQIVTLLKNKSEIGTQSVPHAPALFFESIKYWFCTGAAVRRELAIFFFKNAPKGAKLINLFGTRELLNFISFNVFKSMKEVEKGNYFDIVSIGKPVMNTRIYILDPNENITNSSGVGEIYVSSPGVSGNPPLVSASKSGKPSVIRNPFIQQEKNKSKSNIFQYLLKTGDYGKLMYSDKPSGCCTWAKDNISLYFSGNTESEITVENYKVNTYEIVTHLRNCPGVKGCHVMVYRPGTPSKAVLAFIVVSQKHQVTKEEIHIHLRSRIPEYLIPTLIIIPGLPLKNFKINQTLLVENYQKELLKDHPWQNDSAVEIGRDPAETKACKTIFRIMHYVCGVSEDWVAHHIDWTLAELRIAFTAIPEIYREVLRHGYTVEMQEFFESKSVRCILNAMIRNSPPPAPQIALELIQSHNRYASEIITHSHKKEVIKLLKISNMGTKYEGSLQYFFGMKAKDVEFTILGIWPLVVYKKYSVAIRNKKTNKIVAALLNADCRDKAYCTQWQNVSKFHPLKYRFEVIDQIDESLTAQGLINPKYPLNDLMSIFFINDRQMFNNFEQSIQVLELLFTQVIQIAKSAGFHSMHVTVYDYVFADFIIESFNFEVIEKKQMNLFEARDGTKPYHLAPDHISGSVLYKAL